MELHKNGPCIICKGAEHDNDFDYCRCCGFTVLDIPEKQKQEEESPLSKAIKKARGGETPPPRRMGYA